MPSRAELVEELALEKIPRARRRFRLPRRRDGRRRLGRAGGPRELRRGDQRVSDDRTLIRYLHAAPAHDALRDGRAEVPGPRADGLLAAMDSPSHGLGQRIQHPLLDSPSTRPRRRRPTSGAARPRTIGKGAASFARRAGRATDRRREAAAGGGRRVYQERIDRGVAREQARKDLPLSTYTEAYWKVDLHNLLHFLALRMDAHAQQEIRDYATTIGQQIVAPLFPIVWEAFLDYRRGSTELTRLDTGVIERLMQAAGSAAQIAPVRRSRLSGRPGRILEEPDSQSRTGRVPPEAPATFDPARRSGRTDY